MRRHGVRAVRVLSPSMTVHMLVSDRPMGTNTPNRPVRPLSRYKVAATSRADEAASFISSTYCGHQIRFPERAASLRFRLCEAPLGRISVGALSFGSDIGYDLGETEIFYLVQIAASGTIKYLNGNEKCIVTQRQGMVTSPTRPLSITYGPSSCGLIVKIRRCALERHIRAVTGEPISDPLIFAPRFGRTFRDRYLRLLRFLLDDLEADNSLKDHPVLVANIEDTLMTALLVGQSHNYSARFEGTVPDVAPRQVRDVEDYIREHASEPLSIGDLVRHSGISGRSLFRAFRSHRRTSPMAFLRSVRLDDARAKLLAAAPCDSVTDIALDCGFEHLGRFSAEYARRFSESPSATLRRVRWMRGA